MAFNLVVLPGILLSLLHYLSAQYKAHVRTAMNVNWYFQIKHSSVDSKSTGTRTMFSDLQTAR